VSDITRLQIEIKNQLQGSYQVNSKKTRQFSIVNSKKTRQFGLVNTVKPVYSGHLGEFDKMITIYM
jgi:hypothetical protein